MWTELDVYHADLENISTESALKWERFRGKTVFVTGATGLIGQTVVGAIVYSCAKRNINVRVLALTRSYEKGKAKFENLLKSHHNLDFIIGDVRSLPKIDEKIDYIIHGASVTESDAFIKHPVETIKTSLEGTINVLELAKQKAVTSVVYLSSMEVYGSPHVKAILTEDDLGDVNPLSVRSCYPESKRMAENLCISYASEYDVNVKIARLAQTFGPGIDREDRRVFAQFARCAQKGDDIVLLTDGSSERMYVYTMDAVSAILMILLEGGSGEAYNVANKETYCSIKEMAEMVARVLCGPKRSSVVIKNNARENVKYPPNHYLFLDTTKIESLGWIPRVGLSEMYKRMTDTTF
ncbi:NAD-dependent epimerase/dehydratase family protein [Gehongia tenuis]|uniref:NAD-dependent epimerase/dehydratase family protein n=1 Tax=Gehongia tenuis TaxID=2763655 RepID=A0A926D4P2_9FIRM|nr:NAD-dependent epimerase/dehydratase family protein [Gehongia tenuis]MBC8532360.1 NAD-dependent epimerase/dehydratase family protein [Gehongia tenuis]